MMAGRLRACLKVLRWSGDDLAEELGRASSEVRTWLDGRARVPVAVAAWIEALVKVHRSLPRPNLERPSCPVPWDGTQIVPPPASGLVRPRMAPRDNPGMHDAHERRMSQPFGRSNPASLI
jgi:hypothetical protein